MSKYSFNFSNDYGVAFTVKIHEKNHDGETIKNNPIVGFHINAKNLDSVPLYSYYASTLLEGSSNGLLLDGRYPNHVVNEKHMYKVKTLIETYFKENKPLKPIAVYFVSNTFSIYIYEYNNGIDDSVTAGLNYNHPRKYKVYNHPTNGNYIQMERRKFYLNEFIKL